MTLDEAIGDMRAAHEADMDLVISSDDLKDVIGYLEELKQLRNSNLCIPCSERLPESGIDVLAFFTDRDCVIAYRTMEYNGRTCWVNSSTGSKIIAKITDWMPLPKMQKEREKY